MGDTATLNDEAQEGGEGEGLELVVMGRGTFIAMALPASGTLSIGRSDDADVRVDDPRVSRRHAVIHLGASEVQIEDLGSANGTRVREARLPSRGRATLGPGEAVGIGSAVLTLRKRRTPFAPRRVWPHVYFAGRLEHECERAQPRGPGFCIVRLHAEGSLSTRRLAELLAGGLGAADVLAQYGPGELEVLAPESPQEAASSLVGRLTERLTQAGVKATAAAAVWPRDGRTAESLMSCVESRLREGAVLPAPQTVVFDAAMRRLHEVAARAATSGINVLILGETGAGKEILARHVHRSSRNASGPFMSLSCAAFPETLLESELFGHERGAFTGAVRSKPGLLEAASGGTVFLDEVGEMPVAVQAKLLRVIESREVMRLGAVKPRKIDVRFVAATNRELELEVARGTFRRDLFFRLAGFVLNVPPLRERRAEIEPLARAFVHEACAAWGRPEPFLSEEALALLREYCWPGNVRELRNAVERALVLSNGGVITKEHLPLDWMTVAVPTPGVPGDAVGEARDERERIVAALAACAGNQSRAAKLLGMPRRTLVKRLAEYGIPRPRR